MPANDDELRQRLVDELHRIEEDALFSSKGHFNASQRWKTANSWLGIPTAIMSGLAGASALSQFDHHNVVAGALALLVGAITAVVTFLNPSEQSATHRGFGNRFNALKNKCRLAAQLDGVQLSPTELRQTVIELSTERDQLNEDSPGISRAAFERARKGIEEGEADYRVDRRGPGDGADS